MQVIYCADAEDARNEREFLTACGEVEGKDFILKQFDETSEVEIRALLENADLEEGADFRTMPEEAHDESTGGFSEEGLASVKRVAGFLSQVSGKPVRMIDAKTGAPLDF